MALPQLNEKALGHFRVARHPSTVLNLSFPEADLRVAILFSECIGDLSRAGVRVQRSGNRNPGSREYHLTFNGYPLPYGCGSAGYNIYGFV
jgi:hypothetical protein